MKVAFLTVLATLFALVVAGPVGSLKARHHCKTILSEPC